MAAALEKKSAKNQESQDIMVLVSIDGTNAFYGNHDISGGLLPTMARSETTQGTLQAGLRRIQKVFTSGEARQAFPIQLLNNDTLSGNTNYNKIIQKQLIRPAWPRFF